MKHPRKLKYAGPRGAIGLILVIALAVLAIGGGATYYAATNHIITLPYLTPTAPDMSEIAKALSGIQSAEITTTASMKVEPRSAEVVPLPAPDKEEAEESADMGAALLEGLAESLLGTGDLGLNVTAKTLWTADSGNQQTDVSGDLDTGGITAKFNIKVLTVNEAAYLQIAQLPIPMLDVTPLADQWIDLEGGLDDAFGGESSEVLGSKEDLENLQNDAPDDKAEEDLMAGFSKLWQRMLDQGVFRQDAIDAKANHNGAPAWKITASYDADGLKAVLQSLADDPIPEFGPMDEAEKQELLDDLADPDFNAFLRNLAANTKVEIVVTKTDRMPASLSVTTLLAADGQSETLDNKQTNATVTVTYDRVGEQFDLQPPAEPITTEEVGQLLLGDMGGGLAAEGLTEAEQTASDQYDNVEELMGAVWTYFDANGACPATLDDLIGYEVEDIWGGESKYVIAIPNDLFTGQPLPYRLTATGCELDYHMTEPGARLDDSGHDLGLHTANEWVLSKQYYGEDFDGDGLVEWQEVAHGTDDTDPDTDGDGFSDGAEVADGYNPLEAADGSYSVPLEDPEMRRPFLWNYANLMPEGTVPDTAEETTAYDLINSERASQRDAKRVADIKQVQVALELFHADNNQYPPGDGLVLGATDSGSLCTGGFIGAGLCDEGILYMGLVPATPEPADGSCDSISNAYTYTQTQDGMSYTLDFCLGEATLDLEAGPKQAIPTGIE
jgi:hypothetical protein